MSSLFETDKNNADIDNADIDNADIDNADIDNANIDNADIDNADKDNVNKDNIDEANIDKANDNIDNADKDNVDINTPEKVIDNPKPENIAKLITDIDDFIEIRDENEAEGEIYINDDSKIVYDNPKREYTKLETMRESELGEESKGAGAYLQDEAKQDISIHSDDIIQAVFEVEKKNTIQLNNLEVSSVKIKQDGSPESLKDRRHSSKESDQFKNDKPPVGSLGKTVPKNFEDDVRSYSIDASEFLNRIFSNRSFEGEYNRLLKDSVMSGSILNDDNINQLDDQKLKNRESLIEEITNALGIQRMLIIENGDLSSNLLDAFRLIKAKQIASGQKMVEKEKGLDEELQYSKYLEVFQKLQNESDIQNKKHEEKISKATKLSKEKTLEVEKDVKEFNEYEEKVGFHSINSKTGYKLKPDFILDLFSQETKKEKRIKDLRMTNLILEHKIKGLQGALKSTENFGSGLRLIDFEQLKIENQTFNDKVDERQASINKLRDKIQNCNILLAHIKEKISLIEMNKRDSNTKLKDLNKSFKKLQITGNHMKKTRDMIKVGNYSLRNSCGLLGEKDHLKDFEEIAHEVNEMKDSIVKKQFECQRINKTAVKLKKKIRKMEK